MKTDKIRMESPFKDLFPIDPKLLHTIQEHMQASGYDSSQPIVIWKGHNVVVDGHTRLRCAKNLKLRDVPVYEMPFKNEDEALAYAIHNQRDRRNLTDAEIMRLVETLDRRKKQGDRTDLAPSEAKSGKSAEDTAKVIGTSRSKVEKTRTILDHATDEVKEEVKSGKTSINKAYRETKGRTESASTATLSNRKVRSSERLTPLEKLQVDDLHEAWGKVGDNSRRLFLKHILMRVKDRLNRYRLDNRSSFTERDEAYYSDIDARCYCLIKQFGFYYTGRPRMTHAPKDYSW